MSWSHVTSLQNPLNPFDTNGKRSLCTNDDYSRPALNAQNYIIKQFFKCYYYKTC